MGINEYIQIGQKMKNARQKLGISQKDMAALLNISTSTYSNYENGYREPTLETIALFCNKLNLTIDLLLGIEQVEIVKGVRRKVITEEQNTLLRKYRCLDDHGRELVDAIIDKELERCNNTEFSQKYIKYAAAYDSNVTDIKTALKILTRSEE